MIYTIGYQGFRTLEDFFRAIEPLKADILLDVRSKPYGRLVAFNRKNLEQACPGHGIKYEWLGQTLGGFAQISDQAIAELAGRGETLILLCMEQDPNRCHRYQEIGKRLRQDHGVGSIHLMFTDGVPLTFTL